jgi:hypothetical protein
MVHNKRLRSIVIILVVLLVIGLVGFGVVVFKNGGDQLAWQCVISGGHVKEFSSGNTQTRCTVRTQPVTIETIDNVGYTQAFTRACVCTPGSCWDNVEGKCIRHEDYQRRSE